RGLVDRRDFCGCEATRHAGIALFIVFAEQSRPDRFYDGSSGLNAFYFEKTRCRPCMHEALDALGVLAGVAVLHPRRCLLRVAGNSISQLEYPNCGKSWNRDWWICRRIEAGNPRSASV